MECRIKMANTILNDLKLKALNCSFIMQLKFLQSYSLVILSFLILHLRIVLFSFTLHCITKLQHTFFYGTFRTFITFVQSFRKQIMHFISFIGIFFLYFDVVLWSFRCFFTSSNFMEKDYYDFAAIKLLCLRLSFFTCGLPMVLNL